MYISSQIFSLLYIVFLTNKYIDFLKNTNITDKIVSCGAINDDIIDINFHTMTI